MISASSFSKNENMSLENISEIVKNKQQELNTIHDLQIQQLEKAIDDRNKLLSEASRKFNLLKEDFQYNLTLLEARDVEIQRLSQIEANFIKEVEDKENEIKRLLHKIEKIQLKETENYQNYQNERSKTKKFLLELQEEAESLRWSTNEDMKMKNKEIEHLKLELHHAHLDRKDALDCQRLELTNTYEALLQSKEVEFHEKENEISQQIHEIENRFQHLTSDNTRLKNDLSTLLRKNEKLNQLISEKEEKCIQLEWTLKDRDQEKQEGDDQLHRRIQSLETELNSSLMMMEQLKIESKRDLDKVKIELKRDHEYSQLKIQHWEELYQNSSTEIEKLERQLEEIQSISHLQKKEIETTRLKLIELEEIKLTLQSQLKLYENTIESNEKISHEKMNQFEKDCLHLQTNLQNLKNENENLKKEYEEKIEKLTLQERESIQQMSSMRYEYEEKMRSYQQNHEKQRELELELIKADLEAEYIQQLSDHESEMNENIMKYKELNEKLQYEVTLLKNEKQHYERLYEEEKTESGALKLRLQLLSNQHHQNSNFINSAPGAPGAASSETNKQNNPSHMSGIALPSPMFSEDMGILSIPASPSTPFSPKFQSGKHVPSLPPTFESIEDGTKSEFHFNESMSSFGQSENGGGGGGAGGSGGAGVGGGGTGNQKINEGNYLEVENKKLKGIIREMRHDMESLQTEMSSVLNEKQEAVSRATELENRLQNAISEVNRLRIERKRLMDLNNELRSNLHKQRMENVALDEQHQHHHHNHNPTQTLPSPVSVHTDDNTSLNQHTNPSSNQISTNGKFLKSRASDRQTPSQEAALTKLKEKSQKPVMSSQSQQRKVVNYARQDNFMS